MSTKKSSGKKTKGASPKSKKLEEAVVSTQEQSSCSFSSSSSSSISSSSAKNPSLEYVETENGLLCYVPAKRNLDKIPKQSELSSSSSISNDERDCVTLTGNDLTVEDVVNVALNNYRVSVSEEALENVEKTNKVVKKMIDDGQIVYGVTTGFGSLSTKIIAKEDACRLSKNLVNSHAVAVGSPLSIAQVKAGIVVRINALIKGHSGVSVDTVNAMVGLINENVIPVVPRYGSLACSGDLCLLAHVAMVISNPIDAEDDAENKVYYKNKETIMDSKTALELAGIKRTTLGPKEGLAVTNGSTFSAGVSCLNWYEANRMYKLGLVSLATIMEALVAVPDAFDSRIHDLRNQEGQSEVAKSIRLLTEGSQLIGSTKRVQDAYSIRCAAQVKGVLYESLENFKRILNNEINAATDNPLLVKDGAGYKFLSGGNFHGAPIAYYADSLKLALSELGAESERRIARILDATLSHGLPPMLAEDAGLDSGYMITQYTAASLCLANIQLANPSSVLSLSVCGSQEDVNSNAWNSVLQTEQLLKNVKDILVLEMLCATRGIKYRLVDRKDARLGKWCQENYNTLLSCLDPKNKDHSLQPEISKISKLVGSNCFYDSIDKFLVQVDNNIVLGIPRGTRDIPPQQMIARNKVLNTVREIYIKHGGSEIKTSPYEFRSTLFGKYGDNNKLVFDLDDGGGAKCSLPYDLTVPFARYIAMNGIKQMTRYQCQDVFRRDAPAVAKGRYRSFTQFDLDTVGEYDLMVPDANIISAFTECLDKLEMEYVIKFNHKAFLDLVLGLCNVPKEKYKTTCSSIDKLDKEPWEKIKVELLGKGLSDEIVENIGKHICLNGKPLEVLTTCRAKYSENKAIQTVLDEVELLFTYLTSYKCLDKLIFDLSLARGLDYYTGVIFEAVPTEKGKPSGSSIGGGGRYDQLCGMFTRGRQVPAVGCSLGVDRLINIIQERTEKKSSSGVTEIKCHVTFIRDRDDEKKNAMMFGKVLEITKSLWDSGIPSENVMNRMTKLKNQMSNVSEKGVPFMIIVAENELNEGSVNVKNMFANGGKGEQHTVKLDNLVDFIKSKMTT